MAEANSMTAREAAGNVMATEHADVLRESVAVMVKEIMEAEIAQLAGAELGERAPDRHDSGVREVIGLDVGEAETEAFWTEFLFSLKARGLQGVRVCVFDAHLGLRNAIARVLGCRWQRCTVHFLRDMLGHRARPQQPMIAAAIRQIFRSDSAAEAREHWRRSQSVSQNLAPKVCELLADACEELLCFYAFAREHWPKLRRTNPLERVNKEIGRRWDVVGISPNDEALIRLAGMLLIEQND
jgi:transposase-like protein